MQFRSILKKSTIGELSARMIDFYVEPDLAHKVSEHLKQRLEADHFKDLSDPAVLLSR